MSFKTIIPSAIFLATVSSSHAAIMVEKLNCSAPARGGHIFIATPAPQLKIVSRSSFFGTVTSYILETNVLYPAPTTEGQTLEVADEQEREGWVNLETDGAKVMLKEDNSKATIEFGYGAKSKCKLDEMNL